MKVNPLIVAVADHLRATEADPNGYAVQQRERLYRRGDITGYKVWTEVEAVLLDQVTGCASP